MKNTLFITIHFRDYIDQIETAIKKYTQGNVTRIYTDLKEKGQIELEEVDPNNFDYIFVLVGRGIDTEAFHSLKKRNQKAKIIWYLWDDVERVSEFHELKNEFDQIFSFDRKDCKQYGLAFLPLFFTDDFRYKNEIKDIDISTIGGMHSYRKNLLNKILNLYPEKLYKWHALLKCTKKQKLKEIVKNPWSIRSTLHYMSTKGLSLTQTASILKRSKVTLDMPHRSQTGLTMRTIESLASQTKLVTTNPDIVNYNFYDPSNITVIDIENPVLSSEFINTPFVPLPESLIKNYSLENWVKNLFTK